MSPLGPPPPEDDLVPSPSRHFHGAPAELARHGLAASGPWDCPACGQPNSGALEQGCIACGSGKPGTIGPLRQPSYEEMQTRGDGGTTALPLEPSRPSPQRPQRPVDDSPWSKARREDRNEDLRGLLSDVVLEIKQEMQEIKQALAAAAAHTTPSGFADQERYALRAGLQVILEIAEEKQVDPSTIDPQMLPEGQLRTLIDRLL